MSSRSKEPDETTPLQGGGLTKTANKAVVIADKVVKEFGQDESKMTADEKKDQKKALSKNRTHLQKFLFFLITAFQAAIVYMVSKDMTYGLSILKTTGGPIRLDFTLLIYVSFALSTLSFLTTAALENWNVFDNLRLGIDTANASIQVALVNALATPDWGAYGDLIDVLKYSVQFMVFILYVNVGFTAVFAEHKDPPQFIKNIFDFFSHIDEYFNHLLEPIVSFFHGLTWIVLWPFSQLLDGLLWLWAYLIYPFKYAIAYVVVSIAAVVNWVHYVISSFGSWVVWCLETFIVFPIRWTLETFIVFPIRWVFDTVSAFMKPFWKPIRKCLQLFTGPPRRRHIPPLKNGWLEKEGAEVFGGFTGGYKKRFYTLDMGIFKYFERPGAFNQGEGLKGEVNLLDYTEAFVDTQNFPDGRHVKLVVNPIAENSSRNARTFNLRFSNPRECGELAYIFNMHIAFACRPPSRDEDEDD